MGVGVLILTFLPLVAFYVEYILDEKRHEHVQILLMRIWSWLDDTKRPKLGLMEAKYCLKILDKWVSPKLFSVRRILASTLLSILLVIALLIFVVAFRIFNGLPFQWPFSGAAVVVVNVAVASLLGAASFSITRRIILFSIRFSELFGNSIIYFIALILLSYWVSELFLIVLGTTTAVLSPLVTQLYGNFLNLLAHKPLYDIGMNIGSRIQATPANIILGIYDQDYFLLPAELWDFSHIDDAVVFLKDASNIPGDDQLVLFLLCWLELCFSYLRMGFFIAFCSLWVLRHLHHSITYYLQKFLELKRGALTIMVVGAEAVVSAITHLASHS